MPREAEMGTKDSDQSIDQNGEDDETDSGPILDAKIDAAKEGTVADRERANEYPQDHGEINLDAYRESESKVEGNSDDEGGGEEN
jgi:hypothetical protein